MVSTAVSTTCRFYQLLPHSDSHSQKPAVGVPPCPGKSPGASPAVHSGLCSCTSARHRLDPPVTFTTMCTLGTSPPSCVPASFWPYTRYWPLCSANASESTAGPSPCFLPWPPSLHAYLHPAPAITQAPAPGPHGQVYAHHWFQPPLPPAVVLN